MIILKSNSDYNKALRGCCRPTSKAVDAYKRDPEPSEDANLEYKINYICNYFRLKFVVEHKKSAKTYKIVRLNTSNHVLLSTTVLEECNIWLKGYTVSQDRAYPGEWCWEEDARDFLSKDMSETRVALYCSRYGMILEYDVGGRFKLFSKLGHCMAKEATLAEVIEYLEFLKGESDAN